MKDDIGSSRLRRGGKADGRLALILALGMALTTVMTLALLSVETSSAQPTSCGNGTVDPSEDCDPSSPSGATCLPNEVCVACTCTTCGNGTLDSGEECDLSSPSGALVCDPGEICQPDCTCLATTTTTTTTTLGATTSSTSSTTSTIVTTTTLTTTTLLNHYQCYEIRRAPAQGSTVTIQDQFGTTTGVRLDRPEKLCAPTNKQNEDPGAQNDPAHLKAWRDKHNRPKVPNQQIVNQFGTLRLDVSRPSFLFVPAAKSTTATAPPALTPPTPDHFQCYKVRRSRGGPKFTRVSGVTGVDQFGPYTVDLIKPRWLCAPASKNGEDPTAPTHPEHLLCYKARDQTDFDQRTVTTTDQFGSQSNLLIRRIELCVPSQKNPSAPTTTTTSTTTVTTTSTTTVTTTSSTTVTTTSSTTVTTSTQTTSSTSTVTTSTSTVTTSSTTSSTSSTTTSSTTTTTLYGSPSRAFVQAVRSLLD
jgi:hypothetical protein